MTCYINHTEVPSPTAGDFLNMNRIQTQDSNKSAMDYAMSTFKRIAIIGVSAAGKSVFSRRLASKTKLPLVHMDALFWKGNWSEVPKSTYLKSHDKIIKQGQWIIEGAIYEHMKNRLERADLVIYLDYCGLRCACQLIRRWIQHRNTSRPELPEQALEQFQLAFLWKVLTRGERIWIERTIKIAKPRNMRRCRRPQELEQLVETVFA